MKEFRCFKCNKLLGKIEGKAEIVCPRCKTLNMGESHDDQGIKIIRKD
jgi:phage FluMu protein Com